MKVSFVEMEGTISILKSYRKEKEYQDVDRELLNVVNKVKGLNNVEEVRVVGQFKEGNVEWVHIIVALLNKEKMKIYFPHVIYYKEGNEYGTLLLTYLRDFAFYTTRKILTFPFRAIVYDKIAYELLERFYSALPKVGKAYHVATPTYVLFKEPTWEHVKIEDKIEPFALPTAWRYYLTSLVQGDEYDKEWLFKDWVMPKKLAIDTTRLMCSAMKDVEKGGGGEIIVARSTFEAFIEWLIY